MRPSYMLAAANILFVRFAWRLPEADTALGSFEQYRSLFFD